MGEEGDDLGVEPLPFGRDGSGGVDGDRSEDADADERRVFLFQGVEVAVQMGIGGAPSLLPCRLGSVAIITLPDPRPFSGPR